MNWQFSGDRPLYLQLVDHIRRDVVTGVWPPGSRLPGVRELALQAGVNPNTMQRAMTELEQDKLVMAQRTSGRYVTEDAELIARLRMSIAKEVVGEFVQKIEALGYTKQEAASLVKEVSE